MKRNAALFFVFISPLLFALHARAQSSAPELRPAARRSAAKTPRIAPLPQQLFGAIPLSTHSEEARKSVEIALDKYENAMRSDARIFSQHATQQDPQFALAFAMLSFSSRVSTPDAAALARAKTLLPRATPEEQLLVRWMTSVSDGDLLPAISSMNDLLQRYPKNKHILYLTSSWLYFQQDYDRSRKLMESALQLDPDFSPVLNMLGYAYIETGTPDPTRAIASLQRYAQLQPGEPNPEDSLGEVSRYIGEDRSSLQHYGAALQCDPTFFTSQLGLGDTLTLMGNYPEAREEYSRAMTMADNSRDLFHARFQKVMVYFWEGQPDAGRQALNLLASEAAAKHEPYAQFEIALASAMLTPDFREEIEKLNLLAASLQHPVKGMNESDRNSSLAAVLRERVRIASLHGLPDNASDAIAQLEAFAVRSRDLVVQNNYESARGFLLFAQGDLSNAVNELSSDVLNPLVVKQLILAQEKLGDRTAADSARLRFKYLRAPTVPWFIATHSQRAESD